MAKEYTSSQIQVLSDREHVRQRVNIYLGSTHPTPYRVPMFGSGGIRVVDVEFIPAVYKAVGEIIDNALDEFSQIDTANKTLTINAIPQLGQYAVQDNGRGIPIDMHPTGRYTPEVALSSLKAGRNFTADKTQGVVGQNGVGAACTNYCSENFAVTITRGGKLYKQVFNNGADTASSPVISRTSKGVSGTAVSFKLDSQVFGDVSLPDDLIRARANELAFNNPDVTVVYNGETFKYKSGLSQILNDVVGTDPWYTFTVDSEVVSGKIYVILKSDPQDTDAMFTWVNSSYLFDGGKCNTQFTNALYDRIVQHMEREAKRTKQDVTVTRNDIKNNMLILATLKVTNPEYDSQAKTRLTGPDMRKEFSSAVEDQWKGWTKTAGEWMSVMLSRAVERNSRDATRKAQKAQEKRSNVKVPGLLDATSTNRSECQILLVEGLSARGQISMSRDPATTAAFALTGKINNVWADTPASVLKMTKVADMLLALGLVPGKKADVTKLNYGKIVIASDSDYDGDDITVLLINLFFRFWPELFDKNRPPVIYRLVAPNVCAIKGTKRVHFSSRAEYESVKAKYSGWEIRYYKGLGSMDKVDWDMVLQSPHMFIPIVDDGKMHDTLQLLFGKDADARKRWLTVEDEVV